MKKSLKILTLLAATAITTGCSNYSYPAFSKDGHFKVGILLPVEHQALNEAKEGFISALNEGGWVNNTNVEFVIKNAQGSSDDQRSMAKSLIADCDLTLGLGTGASQDLKSAQKNRGSKNPILFSAVTDPVDANLVKSLEKPGGLVTGASDAQPIGEQISLVKRVKADADKVGVFYTISESNSGIQAKQAKEAITAAGMTPVVKTCTSVNDIQTSLASLVAEPGLDAIYIPTDNNLAANMQYVVTAMKGKGILVVVGEENMLAAGGHLTLSVSYRALGERTGDMATAILNGDKKPDELPVVSMKADDCVKVMNSALLEDAGITLPAEMAAEFNDCVVAD